MDAIVLRDRDLDLNGSTEERIYVQQDANFNVTALTNASGAVQERFIYDPYGSATYLNPDWTVDSGGSDFGWVYLHQGGRWHAESGMYHFRNRDYDPVLGRWVQQDPIRYADGMNLYQAVASAPTSLTDASGLFGYRVEFRYGRWVLVPVPTPPNPGIMVLRDTGATTRPNSDQDKKDAQKDNKVNCRKWAFNLPGIGSLIAGGRTTLFQRDFTRSASTGARTSCRMTSTTRLKMTMGVGPKRKQRIVRPRI